MTGAGTGLRLDGRTYWMEPLTLGRLAACEAHLFCQRADVFDALLEAADRIPLSMRTDLWELAVAQTRRRKALRVIPAVELRSWLDGAEGIAFTGWLCLRESSHPAFVSPEAAAAYWTAHADEAKDFVRRRDAVSGLDLLSQLDWPEGNPKDKGPAYIPWKKIFANLAEARNWKPNELAELTLYSLRICQTPLESISEGFATTLAADWRAKNRTPSPRPGLPPRGRASGRPPTLG